MWFDRSHSEVAKTGFGGSSARLQSLYWVKLWDTLLQKPENGVLNQLSWNPKLELELLIWASSPPLVRLNCDV